MKSLGRYSIKAPEVLKQAIRRKAPRLPRWSGYSGRQRGAIAMPCVRAGRAAIVTGKGYFVRGGSSEEANNLWMRLLPDPTSPAFRACPNHPGSTPPVKGLLFSTGGYSAYTEMP